MLIPVIMPDPVPPGFAACVSGVTGPSATGARFCCGLFRAATLAGFVKCDLSVPLYAVLTEGAASPAQSFLCWRPLTNAGKYAYGIYVFHVPILYFGDVLIGKFVPPAVRASIWFGYASIALLFVVSYLTARFSYNFFERRFLSWKDRFAARYAREAAMAA